MTKYQKKLMQSLELIDTCFLLKEAYLHQRYPEKSDYQIKKLIYREIVRRKEEQWK